VAARHRDALAVPGVTDDTRAEIVASIYDEVTVRGYEVVSVRLTPAAMARGTAFALPQRVSMARPAGSRPPLTVSIEVAGRREWRSVVRRIA
jgi:hypothetical protein